LLFIVTHVFPPAVADFRHDLPFAERYDMHKSEFGQYKD
jgi:hypothetical protein